MSLWLSNKQRFLNALETGGCKKVDLGFAQIDNKRIAILAKHLNDSTIEFLNLTGNTFDIVGFEEFAKALESNKTITTLYLGLNKICHLCISALVKVLSKNTTLKTLYLNNLYINTEFKELTNCLKYNTSLIKLDISKNEYRFALDFAEVLMTNKTLEILNIEDNITETDGRQALVAALEHNTTIRVIKTELEWVNDYLNPFLERNQNKWKIQFWNPYTYSSITCHNRIIASLMCNREFSNPLLPELWKYIFSFWQRFQHFNSDEDPKENYDDDDEDDD